MIVGSGRSDDLRRELARPGIDVLGRVDDLAAVLERIRLTVAPLRFGAGLKDKVCAVWRPGCRASARQRRSAECRRYPRRS